MEASKQEETRQSAWRSPLVIAILAGSVAALGNALVALVNGQLQRNLEDRKAESARILQMISTDGDTERAAKNLDFLDRVGLIRDPYVSGRLKTYLETRKPGDGPTLSTAVSMATGGWNAVPQGSKLCVDTTSDVAVFSAALSEGTKVIASWESLELKSMCESLALQKGMHYTMRVDLAFIKAGTAKIEARVIDASGAVNGKPAAYQFTGSPGDVRRTVLELSPN